jgi:hypothetical protein
LQEYEGAKEKPRCGLSRSNNRFALRSQHDALPLSKWICTRFEKLDDILCSCMCATYHVANRRCGWALEMYNDRFVMRSQHTALPLGDIARHGCRLAYTEISTIFCVAADALIIYRESLCNRALEIACRNISLHRRKPSCRLSMFIQHCLRRHERA